jgi:ABC-type multidrug transport system fused ATPase/permease subunit
MTLGSISGILQRVSDLLSARDRWILVILLMMSMVFAGIEAASISLVMPFIALATDPAKALEQASLARVYHWMEFSSTQSFVVAVGATLVVFYLLRGAFVLGYTYALNRFTWARYYDLATRLFSNYLTLPYREFTQLNSSQLEKSIITEAAYLSQLIVSVLRFLAEAAVAVLLYVVLLVVNPRVTLVMTVVLSVMLGALTCIIRRISTRQGELREKYQSRFYHLLNDAFGNFKFTRQMGAERQMIQEVSRAASGYCRSNVVNTTVAQLPPTLLETMGLALMVGVVLYALLTSANGSQVIPLIAVYGLALYRMMPAAQRMLYYYNNVLYYRRSLDIVHQELSRPQTADGDEPVHFAREIALENVSFNYPGRGDVFTDLRLRIRKNEKVAFIGPSGSGKTTLLDLLIGIYAPDRGRVLIDDTALTSCNVRAWRRDIGYIPQNIFLFDGTVAENVAFGKPYDEKRITRALEQARIGDFLQQHEGLQTHVGEGGVKLSGGQKQRIGIARALYGDPEILVLDEATSALDPKTEAEIMDEVRTLASGRTLIVVSHHNLSPDYFDHIYWIDAGKLTLHHAVQG